MASSKRAIVFLLLAFMKTVDSGAAEGGRSVSVSGNSDKMYVAKIKIIINY